MKPDTMMTLVQIGHVESPLTDPLTAPKQASEARRRRGWVIVDVKPVLTAGER